MAPAGVAASVTMTGFAMGENATTSRLANKAAQTAVRRWVSAAAPKDQLKVPVSNAVSSRQVSTALTMPPPSLMQQYEYLLQTRPMQTKMVTGSFLWGLGDAVGQVVPAVSSSTEIEYDFARTGRAAFFGFAIHAPTSHLHYNLLEWMTVRTGVRGLGIPVFKAFMEQVR